MKYYIGTSGWAFSDWKGKFYPKAVANRTFAYYSSLFDNVELNNTYYRWPTKEQIKKLYNQAPKDFKFSIKCHRLITHVKRLADVSKYLKDFYKICTSMKDKLGCILFQFPPSFKNTPVNNKRLKQFLQLLDKRKNNVFEFRDHSWYTEEIFSLLRRKGAILCTVEGLKQPWYLPKDQGILYIRLHGKNYGGSYSAAFMKKLIKDITRTKAHTVFIYFNNDIAAKAPHNALTMKKLLGIPSSKKDVDLMTFSHKVVNHAKNSQQP